MLVRSPGVLTSVTIKNFKRFDDITVELGDSVVLVGPNNSGKTTVLQALVLWQLARDSWLTAHGGRPPAVRSGVLVNLRDLVATPVPRASLLFHDLKRFKGKKTPIVVEVIVTGESVEGMWTCGFQITHANEESLRVRLLGDVVPSAADEARLALLPPMAGLAAQETKLEPGAIDVRVGEGRTSEVLRNVCHLVATTDQGAWARVTAAMAEMFGVVFEAPHYDARRGELSMRYKDRRVSLDIASAGRGMLQVLLLLSYMQLRRGSVILLDEPDAHLEILRQREMYGRISRAVAELQGQLVVATHSEVILDEATDRDVVVSFAGRPHRVDDRAKSQARKALISIGADAYHQAEVVGWVLYLEGSTDLEILRALATTLEHPARALLERPFVHYVMNQPSRARDHFYGLRDGVRSLIGLALFDRVDAEMKTDGPLHEVMWQRREIENYVCRPEAMVSFAEHEARDADAPRLTSAKTCREAMEAAIAARVPPAALEDLTDEYWSSTKVSDDLLSPLFRDYYARLGRSNRMNKSDYHQLARQMRREWIVPEVAEKLDAIVRVAAGATIESA